MSTSTSAEPAADPDQVLPPDPARRPARPVRTATRDGQPRRGHLDPRPVRRRRRDDLPDHPVLRRARRSSASAGASSIEWAPIGARWLWRSTGGQLLYRRRVVKPRPAGTLALPGDAARLRQWVDPETGAVMVHDPHAATLTAIVGVSHPAFVLLDPAEQERRVVSLGPRPRHGLPLRAHRLASRSWSGRCPTPARAWRTGGSSTATAPTPGRRRRTASSSTAPAPPASGTRAPSRSPST